MSTSATDGSSRASPPVQRAAAVHAADSTSSGAVDVASCGSRAQPSGTSGSAGAPASLPVAMRESRAISPMRWPSGSSGAASSALASDAALPDGWTPGGAATGAPTHSSVFRSNSAAGFSSVLGGVARESS